MKIMNEYGIKSVEEYNEEVDVELRTWLEYHQLPLWFVDEVADKYLNIRYIRERIKALFPEFIKDIKPNLEVH